MTAPKPQGALDGRATTRHLTPEKYAELVKAFRRRPGSISAVARECAIAHTTAHRYWHRGGAYPWAKPIKGIIEGEQEAARALLREEADQHRDARLAEAEQRGRELGRQDAERARQDARDSLRREALIVRRSRHNAETFLDLAAGLLGAAAEIKGHILDALKLDATRDRLLRDPADGIALLRELSRVIADAQTVARTAIELEHLTLGQPGAQASKVEIHTSDEAVAIITRAARALQRTRGLRVIDTEAREPDDDEQQAG